MLLAAHLSPSVHPTCTDSRFPRWRVLPSSLHDSFLQTSFPGIALLARAMPPTSGSACAQRAARCRTITCAACSWKRSSAALPASPLAWRWPSTPLPHPTPFDSRPLPPRTSLSVRRVICHEPPVAPDLGSAPLSRCRLPRAQAASTSASCSPSRAARPASSWTTSSTSCRHPRTRAPSRRCRAILPRRRPAAPPPTRSSPRSSHRSTMRSLRPRLRRLVGPLTRRAR